MQNLMSLLDTANYMKWQLFPHLAQDCFKPNTTHSQIVADSNKVSDVYCPRTFDGETCWDETPAGSTAFQNCPEFVAGYDSTRYVYKKCLEDGTWFELFPEAPKPWTNYTTCVNPEDLNFQRIINNIYITGYAISTAALMLALFIFLYFRSLRCSRTRLHINLFASFTINNLLWIIWYRAVINNVTVLQENKVWCQCLHIIMQYFMVTNYIWIFCEGLHLHMAVVVVFINEDITIMWLRFIGWGLPSIITAIYATVRFLNPDATVRCWVEYSDTYLIIVVPVLISLMAFLLFLANVVRTLLTKMHPASMQNRIVAAKKTSRAAIILVPLFGLQFILILFRPSPNAPGERVYQIISALLTSLQGTCVAILFCFAQDDVIATIKRKFNRNEHNDGFPMTGVTRRDAMMTTRENIV